MLFLALVASAFSGATGYLTSADQSNLFTKKTYAESSAAADIEVTFDVSKTFQTMDGAGAAISGSTAYNLLQMTAENRHNLLMKVFDRTNGMGYSFIRISIGCSDFSLEDYTYCDTEGIENFALHDLDKQQLIPVLKEILAINSNIKIIATPWTPPRWMKVTKLSSLIPWKKWIGGKLGSKHYSTYATYFVKYIEAMKANGITVHYVTPQNEPLNSGNSASCYMEWKDQLAFIKEALGPAFKNAGITTKIVVFDHNFNYDDIKDQQHYANNIYADADAAKYIDGSAWHAYGGSVTELDYVRDTNPEKNIYFTEQSIGLWSYTFDGDLIWNSREVCIGTINRGSKAVIMWNLVLDDEHGPYRPEGCSNCLGAIDVKKSDYATLTFNSHYYTMGHISKVVYPGAKRVANTVSSSSNFHVSTFVNPDNTRSAMALNEDSSAKTVAFIEGGHRYVVDVPAKTVVSIIFAK